jgi:hypothetical protein
MDHTEQSLYQIIASSVKDGCLPEDFSLPSESGEETRIRFADGARDGILLYHMGIQDMPREDLEQMETAVKAASENRTSDAEELLLRLCRKHRALVMIDPLQNWILAHKESLDGENLYRFGMHLLAFAEDTELVKLGLSLLELFRTEDHEDLKTMVRTVGLSDEFTLFSLFVMMKWKDGNREVFELAKKVTGWGRIHALERLKPENEEQEKWILTEGVHNTVLPAYSALTCWQKGRAEEVLRHLSSKEEYIGIRDIILALLDEGPVQGISALENREEILLAFLKYAAEMGNEAEDYAAVREIRSCSAGNAEIEEACDRILDKEAAAG